MRVFEEVSGLVKSVDYVEEETQEPEQVSGVVKWFDVRKGYGFIIPDDQRSDILIHFTVLREAGYTAAPEGATIVCTVTQTTKGLQAQKLIQIDLSTAVNAQALNDSSGILADIENVGDFENCEVKWFNRERGFGFLTRNDDNADIFIHMEILRAYGFRELRQGQPIMARFGEGPKGLMAVEVKPMDEPISGTTH